MHEIGKGSGDDKTIGVLNKKHLGGDGSLIGKNLRNIMPEKNTYYVEISSHDGEELSEEQIAKEVDLDTATALMLDYCPYYLGKMEAP